VATARDASRPTPAKAQTDKERTRRDHETVTSVEKVEGEVARTVAASGDRRVAIVDDPSVKPKGKNTTRLVGPRTGMDFQGVRPGVSYTRVYFAYAGKLVCVDPVSGKPWWQVGFKDKTTKFVTPVARHGLVFLAGSDGVVSAFEEETGALVWSYLFANTNFLSAPCVDGDHLCLTTAAGQLLCLPIGINEMRLQGVLAKSDDPEGLASTYAKVQEAFRHVRNIVRGVEDAPAPKPADKPGANNNNGPQNSGPNGDPGENTAAPPREDEEEKLTRGQWERREQRRADRAKAEGRDYEKKPYKRR
jgi:hypothetical protein